LAGVGHLKKICKGEFSVAGAVQETCSSEMLGGPGSGADFLRGVALWSMSIRSSGLVRGFCVIGAALYMTWPLFRGGRNTSWSGENRKTPWYEAVSCALNFPF